MAKGPKTAAAKPAPQQQQQPKHDAGKTGKLARAQGVESEAHVKNKQRVLILASRGINHKHRHLMADIVKLVPHASKDSKLDTKERLSDINEICEMKNCNNAIFLEARKKSDLYMWMSKTPNGPSVKFHVENIHTMAELNFTGNHMLGSRPLLVFDAGFEAQPHLQVLKSILGDVFGTPRNHRRSKPFHDHILGFYLVDGRLWVRNYQVTQKEYERKLQPVLIEVGPRFVLNVAKVFAGSFEGSILYSNPDYISPNEARAIAKRENADKYGSRKDAEINSRERHSKIKTHIHDPVDAIFANTRKPAAEEDAADGNDE